MKFLACLRTIVSTKAFSQSASRVVVSAMILFALTQIVIAQQTTPRPETDTEVTKQLLKRVEELEARLKELEARQAHAAASSPTPTETPVTNLPAEESDQSGGTRTTPEGLPLETPFVYSVPGAIGYVRPDEVDGSVKVIRVDGRLPGESGYRLTLTGR